MSKTLDSELKAAEVALTEVFLPYNEARLLCELIRAGGEEQARRLATLSRTPRTEVYRILKRLEKKGLIYAKARIPKVYVSLRPREIAEQIVSSWRKKLEFVGSRREKIIRALEAVEKRAYVSANMPCDVFLLNSWDSVKLKAIDLVRKAKKSIKAALSLRLAQDELISTIKRKARKADVHLVLERHLHTKNEKLRGKMRVTRRLPISVIIVDNKRALVILHASKVERLGFLFTEESVVEACKILFEKLWEDSISLEIEGR